MNRLRGGLLLLVAAALSLAGVASAQDPTVSESELDGDAPPPEEGYLDGEGGDPTVSEYELDTSVPEPDESYLATGSETSASASDTGAARSTPGVAIVALLAAAAVAAIAYRRA